MNIFKIKNYINEDKHGWWTEPFKKGIYDALLHNEIYDSKVF